MDCAHGALAFAWLNQWVLCSPVLKTDPAFGILIIAFDNFGLYFSSQLHALLLADPVHQFHSIFPYNYLIFLNQFLADTIVTDFLPKLLV